MLDFMYIADIMPHFLTLLALIYASVEDVRRMHVPDFCFVIIMLSAETAHIRDLLAAGAVWAVCLVSSSLFSLPLVLGTGDFKILAALSFSCGIKACAEMFAAASVLSGLYALIVLLRSKLLEKPVPKGIPFVPFITAAFFLLPAVT